MRIDLVWLGSSKPAPAWGFGDVHHVEVDTTSIARFVSAEIESTDAEAWLFWDSRLDEPEAATVVGLLAEVGDVWHAGLTLGMQGLPGSIDFVVPNWMLNRDPGRDVASSSWRLSLQACLVRVDVFKSLGGINGSYDTLTGASLELGHRLITRGVVLRHIPELLSSNRTDQPELSLSDELRFVRHRFQPGWLRWVVFRMILSGYAPVVEVFRALLKVEKESKPTENLTYSSPRRKLPKNLPEIASNRVSVLIPTLGRYDYLEKLLQQLEAQTLPPYEIIIIDQTEFNRRRKDFYARFGRLPLKVIFQDHQGQSSARNSGLSLVEGKYVLFLDDDDEIPPRLIEAHLRSLAGSGADVSCGVADEVGAGPLPDNFLFPRVSDVFPTNNTLAPLKILMESGFFDVAFDRKESEDHDLGMRIYLKGYLLFLNPEIRVKHHHASQGGLRAHHARVITFASSRQRIFHRRLSSISELYLAKKYYSDRQVREMLWLDTAGTFILRGNLIRKMLKILVSTVLLPATVLSLRRRERDSLDLFPNYPQIPGWSS